MGISAEDQIQQLKQAIADLESQRQILGDETVEAALIPLQNKLSELQSQAEQAAEISPAMPARQRKLVTLLYMDVVGSTAMTRNLDPEDNLEMMENALLRLVEPVPAHGGRVTRYTGDGFKAIFGDPVAREADPEQAIRAGLEMLDVSKELANEIEKEWEIRDFQIRIGIDTGLAALGGQTEAEDTVKGRVVNLAVRIESAAPPGGLLISHNTYRHVRGVFTVDPLDPITAKGFPDPVPVYLVKEIKPRAFRVQTRGVEGVETQMVGRRTELDTLKDTLLTAFEEGEGQMVTICGEAGVGKSRLLYEFQNWIELQPPSQDVRFFLGRGRQGAQGLPYSLLRDLFAFRFQMLDDDTGGQARQKIDAGFREVFGDDEDGQMRAHILGQLLGFDFSASPHLKGVLNDPEQLRNRGVMYLIQYFQELSQEIPVVIFLEDIHWGDDSSLDVVSRIGEFTPQHPLLLICAARPILFERRPYWGEGQPYHTRIELRPLSKRESRQLVTEILKLTEDIPPELRELVVRGAEGNPFYTEELVKMLIEDGVVIPDEEVWQIELTRLEEVDVPSTLAGVLQARLDSLSPQERIVLQQASVVGRLFWDRIVTYIHAEAGNGGDPQLIPHALTSLRNREFVYRHEESAFVGAAEYIFKHDMLRDVIYESVIKRLRKTYHGLVADWLVANCGDRISEYYGLIAEHSLLAGKKERACQYYLKAGEQSLLTYANSEAENQFRRALNLECTKIDKPRLLEGLADSLERQAHYEEAIQFWKDSIDLYLNQMNWASVARLYAKSARAAWIIDVSRSLDICLEGLECIKDKSKSHEVAMLLHETGREYHFSGKSDEASEYCQIAFQMAKDLDDIEVQADTLATLGILNNQSLEESLDNLTLAVELANKGGFPRIESRALSNLGVTKHVVSGDIFSAKNIYERALVINQRLGDLQGELTVAWNLLQLNIQHRELSEIDKWVHSLADLVIDFPQNQYETFLRMLEITKLVLQGELQPSLDLLDKCRTDYLNSAHLGALETVDIQIAEINFEIYWSGGEPNWQELEEVLDELIDLGEAGVASKATVFCLLSITKTFQGNFQEAHQFLEAAKEVDFDYPSFYRIINITTATARLATAECRWEDSFAAYENLIETFSQKGFRWKHAHTLCDWGDVLASRGESSDFESAEVLYNQAKDIYKDLEATWYQEQVEKRLQHMS